VANLRQKPIDQLFRSHDGVLCRTLHLTPTEAEVGWKRTVCHLNDQMIDLSSKGPTDLTSWMSLDGLDLPYVARPKLSGLCRLCCSLSVQRAQLSHTGKRRRRSREWKAKSSTRASVTHQVKHFRRSQRLCKTVIEIALIDFMSLKINMCFSC
jgi:ribosomal protein L32